MPESASKPREAEILGTNVVITALDDPVGTLSGFAKITRDETDQSLEDIRRTVLDLNRPSSG